MACFDSISSAPTHLAAMESDLHIANPEEVAESEIASDLGDGLSKVSQCYTDDLENIGPVLNKTFESEPEFCGNPSLIIGGCELPLVIEDGEGNVTTYGDDENPNTYVRRVFASYSHGTGQPLVEHAVIESLWERSDLLLCDGISLMRDHISIHFPFDLGESIPPPISLECELGQFGMLRRYACTPLYWETEDVDISSIDYASSVFEQIAHPNGGIFNVFNCYLFADDADWNIVSFSVMLYYFVQKHLVVLFFNDLTKLVVNMYPDCAETMPGKVVVKGMMTKFSSLQWVSYTNGIQNLPCVSLGTWEELVAFTRALEHTKDLIFNVYEIFLIESSFIGGTRVIDTEPNNPKWNESFHIYCAHMTSNVTSTIRDDNSIGTTLIDGSLVGLDQLGIRWFQQMLVLFFVGLDFPFDSGSRMLTLVCRNSVHGAYCWTTGIVLETRNVHEDVPVKVVDTLLDTLVHNTAIVNIISAIPSALAHGESASIFKLENLIQPNNNNTLVLCGVQSDSVVLLNAAGAHADQCILESQAKCTDESPPIFGYFI
ncbi:hypothetical protein K7X08_010135 [Anisodus acutangulus]|uniref:C2 domain-containing protein n=1 Tax=Anisodus acutangulus TaxID=402998 RepID=A0A9Q1N6M0_9SOLA|nr:hypothetical protein K7X08_010135 [Anisodus acutangulus]